MASMRINKYCLTGLGPILQFAGCFSFTIAIRLVIERRDWLLDLFRLFVALSNPFAELLASQGELRAAWLFVGLIGILLWDLSNHYFGDLKIVECLLFMLYIASKALIRPQPPLRPRRGLIRSRPADAHDEGSSHGDSLQSTPVRQPASHDAADEGISNIGGAISGPAATERTVSEPSGRQAAQQDAPNDGSRSRTDSAFVPGMDQPTLPPSKRPSPKDTLEQERGARHRQQPAPREADDSEVLHRSAAPSPTSAQAVRRRAAATQDFSSGRFAAARDGPDATPTPRARFIASPSATGMLPGQTDSASR